VHLCGAQKEGAIVERLNWCTAEKRAGLKPGLYRGNKRLKMARAERLRGPNCFLCTKSLLSEEGGYPLTTRQAWAQPCCAPTRKKQWSPLGEGEDEEIALAGGDDGEEAAVGRDGKVAEGETVKDGYGKGLADGDALVCGIGRHGSEGR
jgi:hypothetical protein